MAATRKKTGGALFRVFHRLGARSSGEAVLSDRQRRMWRLAVAAVALMAVLLLLRGLLRLFFFGGEVFGIEIPEQRVERIEITSGEAVPRHLLLEYLQIREGMPFFDPKEGLFARDLGRRQGKVLKAAPALATLSISRDSSNTVIVTATERTPLAKFDSRPFAIDREGVVFARYRGTDQLPSITGFSAKSLEPGVKIVSHRMMAAALELLQCLEAGQSELRKGFLVSIDVSKMDYVTCEFTDGRHATFKWKDMGRGTETSREWLVAQLNGYVKAIQSPRSRDLRTFDVTLPGRAIGK